MIACGIKRIGVGDGLDGKNAQGIQPASLEKTLSPQLCGRNGTAQWILKNIA
jgi:hypothetical protein